MKNLSTFAGISVLATMLVACGSSFPAPTERLTNAEAASRSAEELGARQEPKAALHLKLAQEQITQAKGLMEDGDNRRADFVLQRANADAELSVMLAKEHAAREQAKEAEGRVKAVKEGR